MVVYEVVSDVLEKMKGEVVLSKIKWNEIRSKVYLWQLSQRWINKFFMRRQRERERERERERDI